VRSYRPGRRAVVRVRGRHAAGGPARDTYLKVVPLDEIAGLHDRHRVLATSLPVPRVLAADHDLGLVVLPGLAGQTLRAAHRAVARHEAEPALLPAPEQVLGLLDRLPSLSALATGDGAVADVPARSDDVDFHGRLLHRVLPEARRQINGLVAATAGPGVGPPVTVHGDFHDAQFMVDGGEVSGLLDVDGAGRGTREDDLGTLFGHLSVRALGGGGAAAGGWLAACAAVLPGWVDRAELKRQAAAAVVGLATGPFRVQSPGWQRDSVARLDLAQRWLEADETSLSPLP
jgi:aminoglycoside phosphotransferase